MDKSIIRKSGRQYFLDNLKVFLTMLVIVHHVGQAYGPTGGFWQYKSSLHENIPFLGSFFAVNAAFFMGLFFIVSGYFFPGSYDRKGGARFLNDKLVRLGIPLLFALFIMSPLEMYFYYANYSGNRPLGFLQYFIQIYMGIGDKPAWFIDKIGWPEINLGHLWFVEHLLVYSILYAAFRKIFSKYKISNDGRAFGLFHILSIASLIAWISAVVRIWFPIDRWIGILGFIQSEVAHLPQYAILFAVGIIAYRKNWFTSISKNTGFSLLAVGGIMALAVYSHALIPGMGKAIFSEWTFYESVMAVCLCWGLLVLFREKLNYSTPLLGFLAENSYGAYIFHFPIVLTIQYGLDKVNFFGAWGKFLLVSLLSVVIAYIVSWAVRKITIVRKII